MFGDPITNDYGWPTEPIKKVAPEHKPDIPSEEKYWWLNLDMIETYSGVVIEKVYAELESIGNSTSTFDATMVLYSKLRPYLNKVVVPEGYGYCTNELVGLKPDENVLNKHFLFNLLRSDNFVSFANSLSSGAQMPRMPVKALREFQCILPPIDLQEKFVMIAHQSDKSKFIGFKSQFIEMFGLETKDMKTIDEIANICRGSSPRPISKYVTEDIDGVNWIKIGDVSEEDVYITKTAERITTEGAKKSRTVKPGDFILSNSMSFGRPYLVGINGCVHDGWLIISDYQDYLNPLFFYYELRSELVQRQFDGSANGSCVKNLNSDLVRKVKIHVPSMERQMKFVEFAQQSDKSK